MPGAKVQPTHGVEVSCGTNAVEAADGAPGLAAHGVCWGGELLASLSSQLWGTEPEGLGKKLMSLG